MSTVGQMATWKDAWGRYHGGLVVMEIVGPKGRCQLFKSQHTDDQVEAIREFMEFQKGE